MKHKCDGCKYKGEFSEMGFKPFGVCHKFYNLWEAEKAYNADKCPFKKTNFDRIKAMSVEEMADMLYEESETTYIYCDHCEFYREHAPHCVAGNNARQGCVGAIKNWLLSESEEPDYNQILR